MTTFRLSLQVSPPEPIVARYFRLPYPQLVPMQEFVCDVGITADCHAVVTDCVWRIFSGDDVFAVRQLIGEGLMTLTGGDVNVSPEAGLALRRCYFLEPTVLPLDRLRVSVHAFARETRQPLSAQLDVPLRYYEQRADLRLPFADGVWYAIMGHDWTDIHKADPVSQAFAYDFVRMGADGAFFEGTGLRNEDHFAWGQPVLAPAPGKVIFVRDGLPDAPPGQVIEPERFRQDPQLITGNTVVIGHGHGECSYFGHLQCGSIVVAEGDYVRRGQLIARVGNSGLSQGPHLHYHVQTGPHLFVDQGLPVQFSRFRITGDVIERGFIPSRALISPA
ncbi:MAG: M23 family metallopeptidase [Anaerolineae bacterium]|nr:M23 family metallopeptidase [Caldilineales bacterium]MDW8270014.1 M23 family metallopeptidase [Anaerolineae bacterium]